MKNIIKKLKNNSLFTFILGIIVCNGVVYGANLYNASDISYTTSNGTKTNVNAVINDLNNALNDLNENCSSLAAEYKLENETYSAGELIPYAGLIWYVVKDNSDSVTMILKENYGTGAYGSSTTFTGSTAYSKLNNDFIDSKHSISLAISSGALVSQGSYNNETYYVRLPKQSELSTLIPNESATPFWTETANSDTLYLGGPTGENNVNYVSASTGTYYGGNSASLGAITKSGIKSVSKQSLTQTPSSTTVTYNASATSVNRPTAYSSVKNITKASPYAYPCDTYGSACPSAYCSMSGSQTYFTDTCGTSTFGYYKLKSWEGRDGSECSSNQIYYANGGCQAFYQLNSGTYEIGYRPVVTVYKK